MQPLFVSSPETLAESNRQSQQVIIESYPLDKREVPRLGGSTHLGVIRTFMASELSYGLEYRLRSRYLLCWVGLVAQELQQAQRRARRVLVELEHWRRIAREFWEQPMQYTGAKKPGW